MKECPRCGSSLSHYALSDVEAYGCDSCGWVGIDVEHRSEPVRIESWQDAIRRFHQQFTDSELDEHAANLSRVEAERRAAIGAEEPADESHVEGTDEPESTDEPETVTDEAGDDAPADEPGAEAENVETENVEADAASAVADADEDDDAEAADAEVTDPDTGDSDPDAADTQETARPANSQAE
ncbi:zf-TFIIB domain-containing protein [Haloarchaeobius sp. DT45]|uniref:TFIIB-type zinc ribbon-containing protein n=1 Tax=Haloarchaeobius sp. DT45 TaxID=3446116 RepID=UPI003F6A7A8C